MHAIFGLVPHYRLRAVNHIGLHPFAAMRWQAVHEEDVGFGGGPHVAVYAPLGKSLFPLDREAYTDGKTDFVRRVLSSQYVSYIQ